MKPILWNLGKNIKLKVERGIGFEVVMSAVKSGNYRIERNRSRDYRGQSCFVIRYNFKTWLVPFHETEDNIILHTMFEVK